MSRFEVCLDWENEILTFPNSVVTTQANQRTYRSVAQAQSSLHMSRETKNVYVAGVAPFFDPRLYGRHGTWDHKIIVGGKVPNSPRNPGLLLERIPAYDCCLAAT